MHCFQTQGFYGITGEDFAFPGYRAQGQIKYYFIKFDADDRPDAAFRPHGMYVALHSSYSYANLHIKSFKAQGLQFSNFNVNILTGIQVFTGDQFGLDFFTGLGYKHNRVFQLNQHGEIEDIDPSEFSPYYASNFKFSLGNEFQLCAIAFY